MESVSLLLDPYQCRIYIYRRSSKQLLHLLKYIYIFCTEKRRWTIRTNFFFCFSMTMEGCTRVISRAEVEEVVQGCTIHTGAPVVFPASITVHTSGVWGLHTLSIHRPRHSHPNTFSRRRPRLQHPRYPMSTNETRTRSTGEFISIPLISSSWIPSPILKRSLRYNFFKKRNISLSTKSTI